MIRVKATCEGLLGHRTATRYVIDPFVYFVALPWTGALYWAVLVQNPKNGITVPALVLDDGPWNVDDVAYVRDGARPQAETGRDQYGRVTNGAGIDLGGAVARALKISGDGDVEWERLWPATVPPRPAP